MSSAKRPKQFHALVNQQSLLLNTLDRMSGGVEDRFAFSRPIVLGNVDLLKEFRAEFTSANVEPLSVLLEPLIRDTAPAIAAATAFVNAQAPDAYLLVAPSDARVDDPEQFRHTVASAFNTATDRDTIMTIGIPPSRPETQYGYIERAEPLGEGYRVKRFREKPDANTAQQYLDDGNFLWNAGIFMFRASYMADVFARLQPDVWSNAKLAVEEAEQDGLYIRLQEEAFSRCPSISMDYAIMEKTDSIGVVEAGFGWDDLGSWAQLYAGAPKRTDQNALFGDAIAIQSRRNYVRSHDHVVALAGVDDLTVVAEDGKILVVPTAKSHLVKDVTAAFRELSATNPHFGDARPDAIRKWLFDTALPFWANHGLDHENGGVHEALSFDGTPAPHTTKRLRVLARQIFSFCLAEKLGWQADGSEGTTHTARTVIDHCFDMLTKTGWHGDGGWIHLFDRDGKVHDATRDTYDQCFVLLALAWMIRIDHRADEARHWVDRTLAFLQDHLTDPHHDGLIEGLGETVSVARRANPHMHYLEAMMALYEATGDAAHLDQAEQMVDLFERHFFDAATNSVTEFFAPDWAPLSEPQRCEPGHHYEWAWLLLRFLGHRNRPGLEDKARALFASARALGHHSETGAVADTMMADGTDLSRTARCWPQTEALKAAVAFRKRGVDSADAMSKATVALLFSRYLDGPAPGGWYDQIDDTGRVTAPDMPSSTLYHVIGALAELIEN